MIDRAWSWRGVAAHTRFERFYIPEPNSGCWLWLGEVSSWGYGRFWTENTRMSAHRWSYEYHVGPIPEGYEVDHLCSTPQCVNPAHLEPVTQRENTLRNRGPTAAKAKVTHCKYGHPLSGENVYRQGNHRWCKLCRHECVRRYRIKRAQSCAS